MRLRRLLPGALLASSSLLAACSGGAGGETGTETVTDPAAFTVSYRNKVRLPWEGSALTAERFAAQLGAQDPIASMRCNAETSPAYQDLTSFLGGIGWSHPMAIVKDASKPPLYRGKPSFGDDRGGAASAEGASDAAPSIERPDLVGVNNGVAVFLSKRHGLVAVDARSGAPQVTCAMKLPGEPMNFFFKNDELVVVVNAQSGHNRSALLRFAITGGTFAFKDAVRLPNQNVRDARLFDSTLVLYTDWTKERQAPQIPETPTVGSGADHGAFTSISGGSGGGRAESSAAPAGDFAGGYGRGERLGAKVIVVKWDEALDIDWEDSLLDDAKKQDPMEGVDPSTKLEPGQVVSSWKTWKSFVAASDRYLAIPRAVQRTKFVEYRDYSYQVCTSYNPKHHEVQSCNVQYEKRANPDYKAPNPATGDYSCNGQKLADCIKQAAPVVSQYVYVPVGQTCQMVWVGQCEKYETKTTTYPYFEHEDETELTIYRFESGSFSRLDASLATMVQKNDALSFDLGPLAVKGAVANRNQIQFQNGHLYVFSDKALQTMAVAGSSISYVNRLPVDASTDNNPSVLFSGDRAMISALERSYPEQSSRVEMLDLTEPALPKKLNAFAMPGQSTQLMLATGGVLGPGQVTFTNEQVHRSLQKLTLFAKDDGRELDNLLLGTEYDTFASSWFAASDDQRIRLGSAGTRVFLPYSGRHHADEYEPVAHRLAISRIDAGKLVSERSFEVSDDVVRTAALDDARSLVFADSATYLVDRTSGDWALSTLREMFVPFATYRLADDGQLARVDRVGSKCRVSTFANETAVFGNTALASTELSCPESERPIGFGRALLFRGTRTGVRIADDGLTFAPIPAAEVAALLEQVTTKQYCWMDDGRPSGFVDYLDDVPSAITCARVE